MLESIPFSQLSVIDFPLFLTSYDPSDLPGNSVDPLGFESGYLSLADQILPGLTNVANQPRYFSVLCAGAYLANSDPLLPPRRQYDRRLECLQRFERLWALANALAAKDSENGLSGLSIRGITYVKSKLSEMEKTKSRQTNSDFRLLVRQVTYGMVGIYGAVADGMRLWDRKTLQLTPDLGEKLGEGFVTQTKMPKVIQQAVRDNSEVSVDQLIGWGRRAYISGEPLPIERDCLREAFHRDPVRSRMAAALSQHPGRNNESELQRLKRLLPSLSTDSANQDLYLAVKIILAYEQCYQLAMLGFERLLWLCRNLSGGGIGESDLSEDQIMKKVCHRLPGAVEKLEQTLSHAESGTVPIPADRLIDTRRFLQNAKDSSASPASMAHQLLMRHRDIQQGKLDQGRRKLPWIEFNEGSISLTLTRVGGAHRELISPEEIVPHPYRLASADALIAVAGEP